MQYIGGSQATLELADDGAGGIDLALTDSGVSTVDRSEVIAGWVSVLLTLKVTADFSVDLLNHDPRHPLDQGFADY